VETLLPVRAFSPPMVESITVHADRTAAAAIEDFTLATDAADLLAKTGVPFREAHEVVGTLVANCIAGGKTFATLTDQEWADAHPVFADQRPPLDGAGSVALRDVPGGTAPGRVDAARQELESLVADEAAWVTERRTVLNELFTRRE